MLNNFIQPGSFSTGQVIEGVQSIRGYTSYNQLATLLPAFKMFEEGGRSEDEEKKEKSGINRDLNPNEEQMPEIYRLAVNHSFSELIHFFLTPEHGKIITLRSEFRKIRGIEELTFTHTAGTAGIKLERFRKHLYEVQIQLFQTPKGLHCHVVL